MNMTPDEVRKAIEATKASATGNYEYDRLLLAFLAERELERMDNPPQPSRRASAAAEYEKRKGYPPYPPLPA